MEEKRSPKSSRVDEFIDQGFLTKLEEEISTFSYHDIAKIKSSMVFSIHNNF